MPYYKTRKNQGGNTMKTNMTRILAMMLAIIMMLSMVGCGAKEEAPAAEAGKPTKTSINILMEDVPDTQCVINHLGEFEEATGIKVNIESENARIGFQIVNGKKIIIEPVKT